MSSVHPPGVIAIQGPPGSGHRLLARILNAAPEQWEVRAFHLPGKIFDADAYVLPTRGPEALKRSMVKEGIVKPGPGSFVTLDEYLEQAWEQQTEIMRLGKPYLFVSYEYVIRHDLSLLIATLAAFLGVPPWEYHEPLYDGNEKYGL